jgi:hypothetical protein
MSKEDIVLEWLAIKENRDRVQVREMQQNHIDAFETYGFVYRYGDDILGCMSEQVFKIKLKKNELRATKESGSY